MELDMMMFYYALYIIFIIVCFPELEEVLKVLKEEATEEANVAIEAQKIAASVTKIHTQKLKAAMDLSDDVSTLTLKVLVTTIDAQWEGMGDVGSARYEPALLPPMPDHKGF